MNRIEIKFVRQFASTTTHIMLDSQLPQKFTELVGKVACIILSFMHINLDGKDTTGYFEMFHKDGDVRMLKRTGCEVFFLLEKSGRQKFGSAGLRGVLVGLAIHSHPDWTYIVWSPLTDSIYYRRDVLFNEKSMPFRDARNNNLDHSGRPRWLRRDLGQFCRSHTWDIIEDLNLDGWDADGINEPPLNDLGVADWLPLHDGAGSPIQPGDTLFIADNPTEVLLVSPTEIRAKHLLTHEMHIVPASNNFFRDPSGMLTGGATFYSSPNLNGLLYV
jgi:hypothetical protein